MNRLREFIPKVKKITLLLVVSIIWFVASVNVIFLGIKTLKYQITIYGLVIAAVVFTLFFKFIFSKMVVKHTVRILGCENESIEIYKFFDAKSYLIMIFMITFGVTLRKLNIIPNLWLGSVYLGIGSALLSASVGFFIKYMKFRKQNR